MAPKVIKSIIKSRSTEKTVVADLAVYEKAFASAVAAHGSSAVSLKKELESLSLADLKEAKEYLIHDKSAKMFKYLKVVEFLPSFKAMLAVQSKLAMAMDAMKKLVVEELETNYADSEGTISMDSVKDAITARVAVLESQATHMGD